MPGTPPYVEVHAHSAFSFADGTSLPHELIARAGELGHTALGLTDHDSLAGAMEFAMTARDSTEGEHPVRAIFGAEVTIAALGSVIRVKGSNGITLHADSTLDTVQGRKFDCIFLPGGPGVRHLRADARVPGLVRSQYSAGRWVAAICAAPTVLNDAGILAGRRYTAHFSVAAELPQILASERVVADGKILTSRGAGTALDFGLLLVEKLFSPEKSSEVAQSICA